MAETGGRTLAAIMFTDMVGYSALTQKNEPLALELLEAHRKLLRPVFPNYGGKEIKTIGDAFMVEFRSALEAARCAIELQRTLLAHNDSAPPEKQIQIRIGIHVGDVVHRGKDVFGDAVNIASRVEPIAQAGGICVSEDVARQVQNKIEEPLRRMGKGNLKNIQLPVEVYEIVLPWREREEVPGESERAGSAPAVKVQRASKAIDSLAVLPLTNLSGDPEMEYLSDGITDSLINSFSEIKRLRVVPRSIVFRYKGREVDPQQAGHELNARAVLTGRVLLRGETLVIGAELLDVASVSQLWGAQYRRKFADIFAIEEEIAREISEKLRVQLTGEEKKRLTKSATQNKEAYQLYLKAVYFSRQWADPEDLKKGLEYARQAIETDPAYAPGHAVLADCYTALGYYNLLPPAEAFPKAKNAALKALEFDEGLAQAHTSLAMVSLLYDWDWSGADREFRRALELNPHDAQVCAWHSMYLASVEQLDQAVAEAKRGMELDPTLLVGCLIMGISWLCVHKYEDAIKAFGMALEIAPNNFRGRQLLAFSCAVQGRYEEALAACKKLSSLPGGSMRGRALEGYCYALAAKVEEARGILEQVKQLPGRDVFLFYNTAALCTALGEFDRAFELLNKLVDERFGPLFYLKQQPWFEPLHSDPRFVALLRRIGIPQ